MATLDITAVLLVGGMGTRLRSVVPSAPKPLASMGDVSFLELLVRQIRTQGIRRLIMCSGYLADQIEAKFGDGRAWDVTIEYSREQQPLGTAGAINQVRPLLRDAVDFVVMNGDSFLDADFGKLVDFRRLHKSLVSLAIVQVENAGRYGTVSVGPDMRVIGFNEKTGISAAGLINAGIYVFDRTIFDYISDGPSSLERDVFPRILERGIYALQQEGLFIDIGTPEDYARARTLFEQLSAAASRQ